MNLGEAADEFAERGFDYLSADRRYFYLNQGKNTFEDVYPWPWLEATATGASPLTITDLKYVLYVRDSATGSELLGMDEQDLVAGGDSLTDTGSAGNWWLNGSNIITGWPVSSSSVLDVRYIKESPELAVVGDTPLIPVRYHNTWIDLAVIRAYVDSDNYVAAQGLRQIVDLDLNQLKQRYGSMNRQNTDLQVIRAGSEDW